MPSIFSANSAASKRVLRYLSGTPDVGLKFMKSDKSLTAFADADWGASTEDRGTGFAFMFANAAVSWESQK